MTQSPLGSALEQPLDRLRRVRAVPHLVVGAPFEPAGELDVGVALDRAAEERLRGLARAARPHLVVGQEVGPLRLAEHDDRARLRDGELLPRDRLARLAEDVRVLEPDVRQEDDRRVEDVRRVEPAAEAGFDRGRVDALRRELGQRRRRQRLELRRADALGGARTRPTARSKPSASVSSRSSQPDTCGDVYAPTRSPSPRSSAAIVRVAVDFPFVPTTCTERNARSGWPSSSSSARIRSSPNSSGHGESDAIQAVCGPITGNVDDSRMHAYR